MNLHNRIGKGALTAMLVIGMLASSSMALADTSIVTANGQGNWRFESTSCVVGANPVTTGTISGSQIFETGPGTPPLGAGSLELRNGSGTTTRTSIGQTNLNNVALASLTDLRYSTVVTQGANHIAPYIVLNIDTNGDAAVDDHLVFEPRYQNTGLGTFPFQSAVQTGIWQTWDAFHGGWYSVNGIGSAVPTTANLMTLSAYIGAHPTARIINNAVDTTSALQVAVGCGASGNVDWVGAVTNVDTVIIGTTGTTTTYDFEASLPSSATLTCSPASTSATVGNPVSFTAAGGNGSYSWTAPGVVLDNAVGQTLTMRYGTSGARNVTVTSGSQTASCSVNVLEPTGNFPALSCSASAASVMVGNPVSFTATGGTGTYTWTAPGVVLDNAVGQTLTMNYGSAGPRMVSVTSGAQTATCSTDVFGGFVPPIVPGLPNTGEGGMGMTIALIAGVGLLLGVGVVEVLERRRA